jgi:hypothetical protein
MADQPSSSGSKRRRRDHGDGTIAWDKASNYYVGKLSLGYNGDGKARNRPSVRTRPRPKPEILEQVTAARERLLGSEHPDTLSAFANLGALYGLAGRTDESIAILERVVDDMGRLLGPKHPDTLTARANLATLYRLSGRTDEAVVILEEVAVGLERLLGPDHPATLTAQANLVMTKQATESPTDLSGNSRPPRQVA